MRFLPHKKILFFTLLFLAACGSDRKPDKLTEIPGPITSGSGSNFSPTGSGNEPPPVDSGKAACTDSGPVTFSAPSVDFGTFQMSKPDDKQGQCEVLTTTSCGKFSVEVENDQQSLQFGVPKGKILDSSAASLSGSVKICYARSEVGIHKGNLKIFTENGQTTILIPLNGETLPRFFTVIEPTANRLVWEKDPGPATDPAKGDEAPYLKAFPIQATGFVDMGLEPLIKKTAKGELFTISVRNGGQTTAVTPNNGNFNTTIEIPETGGVYSVIFKATMTNGKVIEDTVPVIRYTKPAGSVEVRDDQGNLVKSAESQAPKETNSPQLTAGILISNLNAAGPAENNRVRVSVKISKPEGGATVPYLWYSAGQNQWLQTPDKQEAASLYLDQKRDSNDPLKCKDTFTKPQKGIGGSVCIPLPFTKLMNKGVNYIEVSACNDYTDYLGGDACTVMNSSLIVDNDLPRITIDRPRDNQVFKLDEDVILKGTIENFAPPAKDSKDNILCNVKFWLNTSVDKAPLPGCLEYLTVIDGAYDGVKSGNQGNLRRANFYINLSKLDFKDKDKKTIIGKDLLTLYTNLVRIEATNAHGHTAIKVVSFQRGEFKESDFANGTLSTKPLYEKNATGKITRAPLMLNIAEGTLKNSEFIAVIEKLANDNLKLKDLIQGYTPTKDGKIPTDIEANAHLSGVAKVMAWVKNNRKNFKPSDTNNSCDFNTLGTCAAILFPDNLNDPRLFGNSLNNESFWAPVVFGKRDGPQNNPRLGNLLAQNGSIIKVKPNGFPVSSSDYPKIWPNYDFDDTWQGPLTVDKLDLRSDGNIEVQATIHGFTGHAFAFAMCEYGSLSFPPVIPFYFNIEKLTVKLVLTVKNIQLDKNGKELMTTDKDEHGNFIPANAACSGGNCSLKLIIDPNSLKLTGSEAQQGLFALASKDCTDPYLGALYTSNSQYDYAGCHLNQSYQKQGHPENYWAVGETRVNSGTLSNTIGPSLLPQLQDVLRGAIHDIVICDTPKTLVNPLFDEHAFAYKPWVPQSQRLFKDPKTITLKDDLKLTLNKVGSDLIVDVNNGDTGLFGMSSTLKELDLAIFDGGINLKFPIKSLRANGVSELGAAPFVPDLTYDPVISAYNGRMYRNTTQPDFDSAYPLREIEDDPYASISLNVEEVVNAVAHLLFRKGKDDLLDLFSDIKTKLAPPPDANSDAWTIGIDKVILGRFDICNNIAGKLLSPNFPAKLLFNKVAYLFGKTPDPDLQANKITKVAHDDTTHWDIRLDKTQPPTLTLQPVPGDATSTYIQLGLSNVQIDIRELMTAEQETKPFYKIGDKVLTLRVDGIIKLKAHYDNAQRQLDLSILPYSEQVLYASVVDGGAAYNDKDVINDFVGYLLVQSLDRLKATDAPSLSIRLPEKISDFNQIETFTVDSADSEDAKKAKAFNGVAIENHTRLGKNDSCKGLTPPAYLNVAYKAPPDNDSNADEDADDVDPECTDSAIQDNDITAGLCEVGLKEITFGNDYPHLKLDAANGYMHLSTSLFFKIYDWLAEEVSP